MTIRDAVTRPQTVATVFSLVLIGISGFSVFQYVRLSGEVVKLRQETNTTGTVLGQEDGGSVVDRVKRIILLPSDEQPTVATVSDIDKLKDQEFFTDGQNGDKVLIYTKAKKAFLYRPTTNQIIATGPLNINTSAQNNGQNGPSVAPTVASKNSTQTYTVTLFGSASTSLKFGPLVTQMQKRAPEFGVIQKNIGNLPKGQKSVIVDVTGNKAESAKKLSDAVGFPVAPMPLGISTPSSDLLVILGN